jgi:nitrogen regulatory protein PII-like uncharacterized protein
MKKVKAFLKKNGFESFLALVITVLAIPFVGGTLGLILSAGSAGFFVGRNREIIKELWKESKLKDKIEDKIEDVKDKF